MINIFKSKYEERKDIFYAIGDRSTLEGFKYMVRCGECGRRFKMERENFCPECNKEIKKENPVILEQKEYLYYNAATNMFVDERITEEGKEIIATVSMLMISLYRPVGQYYPVIGDNSFRLRVRFNISKRTAILYVQKLRYKDDNDWDNDKLSVPFINFTQPIIPHLKNWDIILPNELIDDLRQFMNLKNISKDDYKNIDLYSLAWLNRIRDYNDSARQREILSTLNGASLSRNNKSYFEKNVNRVKRYIASNHKTKEYDEKIFEALCKAMEVDRKLIPKEFEKHYYLNPAALKYVDEHNTFFHNRDIRVNAIEMSRKSGYKLGRIFYNPNRCFHDYFEDDNEDVNLREEVLKAFKTEKNIFYKIRGYQNYAYLYDTAKMINQLRDANIKVKTKGNLRDLHDKISVEINKLEAPKLTFLNSVEKESIDIDKIKFNYAKSPMKLIQLGEKTKTCVASYYEYCLRGYSLIVYLKKKDHIVGLLEVSDKNIVQAKGFNNKLLNNTIQKLISKFAVEKKYYIKTNDISKKIRDKHNDIIKEMENKGPKFEKKSNEARFVNNPFGPFVA